ncbi:MAG: sugar ABC transporter ATP-binding protein [Allorhizobium sp.]
MTLAGDEARTPVLVAERISKSFGEVQVLFSVDFDVLPGEVHALMGENGAGKSTLVKILSGFEQATAGRILLDGEPVTLPANGAAEALGIVLIHQEFNLADHLTVTESLFLGREVTRFGLLDRATMRAEARRVLDQLGSRIDENALISSLAVADKQMVEIAKAISRKARIVFMDEPTAVLSRDETEVLFDQVRKLRARGTSFVFVSHKLDEVMELTDRVTVLRDGQWVKTAPTSALDSEAIAQLMVGRELSSLYPTKHEPNVDEEIVLSVRDLTTGFVKNASFELKRGEVLGFSGLIGSGRTELMEAVAGLRPRLSGEVRLKGAVLNAGDFREANRRGLAYMTKDRKGKGLLLGEGMTANLTLQSMDNHVRHGYLDPGSEAKAMARAKRRFDIRVRDDKVRVGRMSGGNQQKLLLAKIMEVEPQIIIIDEPTRGIDVGAHAEIVRMISRLREDGLALVVISSELDEIVSYSSRVVVMRDRKMVAELHGADITPGVIVQTIAALPAEVEA